MPQRSTEQLRVVRSWLREKATHEGGRERPKPVGHGVDGEYHWQRAWGRKLNKTTEDGSGRSK
jgi:hypothetical protein